MNKLQQGLSDVLELIFPSLCIACGERLVTQERFVCFACWSDLPRTHFHENPENKVAQLFWSRVNIENATSWYSYKKGSIYQNLIHFIKYKGLKELGYEAGMRYGFELKDSGYFNNIDSIVPVPLHPKKEKKRGYNQCDWIARGLGEALQKEVKSKALYRNIYTGTQTRKNRYERFQNVDGIFSVNQAEDFEGKHILLVDDVVTTGSTLEACAYAFLKIEGVKVSIATLAFADY